MFFFVTSFLLNLKKFANKKALWVMLFLLPFTIFIGSLFLQTDTQIIELTAGVFFNSENPLEASVFEHLDKNTNAAALVRFMAYDDLEALKRDIRLGRIECGYILNPNFDNAARGNFSQIITLVSSPRTVASPILNDIVAAAVLAATVEAITLDGLISFFGESEELKRFFAWQFEAYTHMDIFMTPDFIGESVVGYEEPMSLLELTKNRIFYGLIGLAILIMSLFCTPLFIEERNNGLKAALNAHGKLNLYDFSLWASAFTVSALVGAQGYLSLLVFAPQLLSDIYVASIALALYTAVCAAFLALAARFMKTAGPIQSFGLFIVILNIFFGGVLFDLTWVSPGLGHMQYLFPLYWYIEIILGR